MDILSLLKQSVRNLKDHNVSDAINNLEWLEEQLKDILFPHWDIQSSDEQYSDPEMWDYEPVYDELKGIMSDLYFVYNWTVEDEGLDSDDIEKVDDSINVLNKLISDLEKS